MKPDQRRVANHTSKKFIRGDGCLCNPYQSAGINEWRPPVNEMHVQSVPHSWLHYKQRYTLEHTMEKALFWFYLDEKRSEIDHLSRTSIVCVASGSLETLL